MHLSAIVDKWGCSFIAPDILWYLDARCCFISADRSVECENNCVYNKHFLQNAWWALFSLTPLPPHFSSRRATYSPPPPSFRARNCNLQWFLPGARCPHAINLLQNRFAVIFHSVCWIRSVVERPTQEIFSQFNFSSVAFVRQNIQSSAKLFTPTKSHGFWSILK